MYGWILFATKSRFSFSLSLSIFWFCAFFSALFGCFSSILHAASRFFDGIHLILYSWQLRLWFSFKNNFYAPENYDINYLRHTNCIIKLFCPYNKQQPTNGFSREQRVYIKLFSMSWLLWSRYRTLFVPMPK